MGRCSGALPGVVNTDEAGVDAGPEQVLVPTYGRIAEAEELRLQSDLAFSEKFICFTAVVLVGSTAVASGRMGVVGRVRGADGVSSSDLAGDPIAERKPDRKWVSSLSTTALLKAV